MRHRGSRLLCAALSAFALLSFPAPATALRGVQPSQAQVYRDATASGTFTCLDGSARIPAGSINDNYCDCADGSDEPGTSACPAGTFYCRNRGHQPLVLTSSFVDDGVCDCCDGSDEARGACGNDCVEQGRAAREALQAAAREAGTGNKVRRARARDAAAKKGEWRKRVEQIQQEEEALRPKVKALEEKKDGAAERERKAREAKEKVEAAAAEKAAAQKAAGEAAQPAEEAPASEAADAEAAGDEGPAEVDGAGEEQVVGAHIPAADGSDAPPPGHGEQDAEAAVRAAAATADPALNDAARNAEAAAGGFGSVQYDTSPEALAAASRAMQEAAGQQTARAAQVLGGQDAAQGQTEEERARERMAQWIKPEVASPEEQSAALDGEAGGLPSEAGEAEEASEEETDEDAAEEAAAEAEELEGLEEEPSSADDAVVPLPPASGLKARMQQAADRIRGLFGASKPAAEEGPLAAVLEAAEAAAHATRDAWSAENNKLSALDTERQELNTKLQRDYGPEDVFLPLDGQCFSVDADKYTYEVCPYGNAAQKEGGSSTSLGRFERFEEDYRWAAFQNGAGCWQGPARSIKLELSCGAKEELSSVSEPSRCVYAAKLKTPSVCTKALQERWQAEADAAQRELEGTEKDEL